MPDAQNRKPRRERDRYMALVTALADNVGNLSALLNDTGVRQPISLTLRRRAEGDWMVIAKAYDPETHEDQVAFGFGFDWQGAMTALNANIAGGRWRKETPYKPPIKMRNNGGNGGEQALAAGDLPPPLRIVEDQEGVAHKWEQSTMDLGAN